MRFYTQEHRFYCGVDLHARTMYLCILDAAGQVVYDHNLAATWQLDRAAKAVLALLFLRGAQTAGELRSRSDRMHEFVSVDDVEATLRRLAPARRDVVGQVFVTEIALDVGL